jgi:hypothetical protein
VRNMSRKVKKNVTKPSPQLLWISLLIRSPYHQNIAHFSTFKTSLPKN